MGTDKDAPIGRTRASGKPRPNMIVLEGDSLERLINRCLPTDQGGTEDKKLEPSQVPGELRAWKMQYNKHVRPHISQMQRTVGKVEFTDKIIRGIAYFATLAAPAQTEVTEFVNAFIDMHWKKLHNNTAFRNAITLNCLHNSEVADHLAQHSGFTAYAQALLSNSELTNNLVEIAKSSPKLAAKLISYYPKSLFNDDTNGEAYRQAVTAACIASPATADRLSRMSELKAFAQSIFDNNELTSTNLVEIAKSSPKLAAKLISYYPKALFNDDANGATYRQAVTAACIASPATADRLSRMSEFKTYAQGIFVNTEFAPNDVPSTTEETVAAVDSNLTNIAKGSLKLAAKLILHKKEYNTYFDSIIKACAENPELAKKLLKSTHFFNWCVTYFLEATNGADNWVHLFKQDSTKKLLQALITKDSRFRVLHNLVKVTHFDKMKEADDEKADFNEFNAQYIRNNLGFVTAIRRRISAGDATLSGSFADSLPNSAYGILNKINQHDSNSDAAASIQLLKSANTAKLVSSFDQSLEILLKPENSHKSSNFRYHARKVFSKKLLNSPWLSKANAWQLQSHQLAGLMLACGEEQNDEDAAIIKQLFQQRKRYAKRTSRLERLIEKTDDNGGNNGLDATEWLALAAEGSIKHVDTVLKSTSLNSDNTKLGRGIKKSIKAAVTAYTTKLSFNPDATDKIGDILDIIHNNNLRANVDHFLFNELDAWTAIKHPNPVNPDPATRYAAASTTGPTSISQLAETGFEDFLSISQTGENAAPLDDSTFNGSFPKALEESMFGADLNISADAARDDGLEHTDQTGTASGHAQKDIGRFAATGSIDKPMEESMFGDGLYISADATRDDGREHTDQIGTASGPAQKDIGPPTTKVSQNVSALFSPQRQRQLDLRKEIFSVLMPSPTSN